VDTLRISRLVGHGEPHDDGDLRLHIQRRHQHEAYQRIIPGHKLPMPSVLCHGNVGEKCRGDWRYNMLA
jgi:hypothetical protein